MHLHQAIAGLSMSPRIEEFMRQLLAELRLAFHVMNDPKTFHAPYLTWHRRLIEPILAGDMDAAERMLHEYLDVAERQLLEAFSKLQTPRKQAYRPVSL
jgi:DNA-binding FadR family transcriptional regulator